MANNEHNTYDSEMRARLWEHRLAINHDFSNLANFFLLAESILLATSGAILGSTTAPRLVLYVLIILGLVLTTVWIAIQSKQRRILSLLKKRCEEEFREYRETRIARNRFLDRVSNIWLMTYFVPLVFACAWVSIAAVIVFKIQI